MGDYVSKIGKGNFLIDRERTTGGNCNEKSWIEKNINLKRKIRGDLIKTEIREILQRRLI